MIVELIVTINNQDLKYSYNCDKYISQGNFLTLQQNGKDVASFNLNFVKVITIENEKKDLSQVQSETSES
jgi:hypothetical protein